MAKRRKINFLIRADFFYRAHTAQEQAPSGGNSFISAAQRFLKRNKSNPGCHSARERERESPKKKSFGIPGRIVADYLLHYEL